MGWGSSRATRTVFCSHEVRPRPFRDCSSRLRRAPLWSPFGASDSAGEVGEEGRVKTVGTASPPSPSPGSGSVVVILSSYDRCLLPLGSRQGCNPSPFALVCHPIPCGWDRPSSLPLVPSSALLVGTEVGWCSISCGVSPSRCVGFAASW